MCFTTTISSDFVSFSLAVADTVLLTLPLSVTVEMEAVGTWYSSILIGELISLISTITLLIDKQSVITMLVDRESEITKLIDEESEI